MGEFCPGYNDSRGQTHPGFMCPLRLKLYSRNDFYCCGNHTWRNCCSEYFRSIFVQPYSYSTLRWMEYWPYVAFVLLCVVILAVTPFVKINKLYGVQNK